MNIFQQNFARVHFNTTKVDIQAGQLRQGTTPLRYAIVKYDDVISDLKNWDTFVTSTYMGRPYELAQLDRWYITAEERLPPSEEIVLA